VSAAKGTNAFGISSLSSDLVSVRNELTIPEGNYSNLALIYAVQTALNNYINETYATGLGIDYHAFNLTQDSVSGRLKITLNEFDPFGVPIPILKFVKIIWYDPQVQYTSLRNAKLNNSLGYMLGFRTAFTALYLGESSTSPSIVSANGTRYLLLQLDDHTSNRPSSGILHLGPQDRAPKRNPYKCRNVEADPNLFQDKVLTAKQVFSESARAQQVTMHHKVNTDSVLSDVFAKIPMRRQSDWNTFTTDATGVPTIKVNEDGPGRVAVEMGGTLQQNKRVYLGPVNLSTLTLTLRDEHGNLLGLNGHDWSCSISVETSTDR
jgi:hypothetical protein